MTNLKYLTLDLFAYNLIDGLGLNKCEAQKKCDSFWKDEIPQQIKDNLPGCKPDESDNKLKFSGKVGGYSVDGSYNRKQFEDTYSWLFDCSVDKTIALDKNTYLSEIKKLIPEPPTVDIAPDKIPPEYVLLGQTWMISGWQDDELLQQFTDKLQDLYQYFPAKDSQNRQLENFWNISGSNQDKLQKFAIKLYQDLGGKDWHHQQVGKFLGGAVFEVWRSPQKWDKPEDNSHAIIIFYPNKETFDKAGEFYDSWRYLLYCRHKIWFAYQQSRNLKQNLKTYFNQVIGNIKKSPLHNFRQLENGLQENLKIISKYAVDLNTLIIQAETIEVNLENYNNSLQKIERDANKFANTNLDCEREFSEIVTNKYQRQIEKDYASLAPGLEILKNMIDTIRGLVEVEKVKSDRRIERNIAIAGFGIGAASASASSISPFIETITGRHLKEVKTITDLPSNKIETKEIPIPSNAWFNFWLAFLISMVVGAVFGFATWGVLALLAGWRSHTKR